MNMRGNIRGGGMGTWGEIWGSLGDAASGADYTGALDQLLKNWTGGGSGDIPNYYPQPAPVIIQQPAPAKDNTGLYLGLGIGAVALIAGGVYLATRKK